MKTYFFVIVSFLLLYSCKKETRSFQQNSHVISQNINFQEDKNYFTLKSGNHKYKISRSALPFKKIVLLNSSLLGYLLELNTEEKIIGISSPEYVYSGKIHQLLRSNKIQNVGNEQKYNIEKIIALKPDAVFTNYVASFENTYKILKKNDIEIIFIDEYLEEKPLEKAAIIIVFGALLGKKEESEKVYSNIERNYYSYKKTASESVEKPRVLTNEMYGNQWFVAGGKTQIAHFIKDAGAIYIFGDNSETKSIPKSFEEVFSKSQNAEFWVNVGNHVSKKELLAINPNYTKMKVYQKGNIYTISGKQKENSNDFFERGVVRADLILKDYIKIFHPNIFPKDSLVYMKKLK